VSTFPLPTEKAIISHYRKKFKSGNYELARRYAESYLTVYRDMARRLSDYVVARGARMQGAKLLDVGTFTGEFLEAAHELKMTVYGTELQKDAVAMANKKFPGRVMQANVYSTRFPKKNFDVITLLGLIEHVTTPDLMIERVTKLLRPGGIIMLQTPNSDSWLAHLMGKLWFPYAPVEHINLFSRQSLERLLIRNGYTHISYQRHVKQLPVDYVYENLRNFGPEFHALLKPFAAIIHRLRFAFPVYGGEMIIVAQKMR
jgi:SAM-dependent methyltransferase